MSTQTTEPATPAEPAAGTQAGAATAAEGAKPDEPLGAPGLAALQSERQRADAAEKAAKDLAAKVQAFEDRDKSDAQKQQEALERTQKELAELTVAKTRAEVAAAKGVPVALLTGSTQEDIEKAADALIAFKGEQPKQKLIIPSEGKAPSDKQEPASRGIGTLRAAYAQAETEGNS